MEISICFSYDKNQLVYIWKCFCHTVPSLGEMIAFGVTNKTVFQLIFSSLYRIPSQKITYQQKSLYFPNM